MSATFVLEGGAALRAQLTHLPAELTQEGGDLVRTAATRAVATMTAAYPVGPTGNLKRGVRVRELYGSRWGVRLRVTGAPHAHLYEFGTEVRNFHGANRGRSGPHPTFLPAMEAARRGLTTGLRALLARAGLAVTGP